MEEEEKFRILLREGDEGFGLEKRGSEILGVDKNWG